MLSVVTPGDHIKSLEPRDLQHIFDDLRTFAQSNGALHDISALMDRDWVVAVDLVERKVADEPEKRGPLPS
ncbi:hypothetical protein C7I85_28690 [Mesorhizobium soli]|uniref:Uncharacterized protein n=1 Tax=Pseudaminobacter soli (ex Li et al. 2025) TaxID=1295366 RepID=A0A2P7RR14_9HYPH|nr:hypothetical protein C7I85_28690 [Mesorhizobium soli]